MRKILARKNGFDLVQSDDNFYSMIYPLGNTCVNTSGSKQELVDELMRWKKEVDMNNPFMLEVENTFINALMSK